MKRLLVALFVLVPTLVSAESQGVLKLTTDLPLDAAYTKIHDALEESSFWVVFEADMGSRMARFAEKWGDDYNRNRLTAAKSMVFCNIWWTNRIANGDPDLLALCPLHLSLYTKDGTTVLVMPKPSVIAEGSPGKDAAVELETELSGILEKALKKE